MFPQYIYCVDNPLTFIDPMGEVRYGVLNELAFGYSTGALTSELVAGAIIPITGGNPSLALHQLTQVFVAGLLMKSGWTYVQAEYYFSDHGATQAGTKRADVVGMFGQTMYLFEVKPLWMAASAASSNRIGRIIRNQVNRYYSYLQCIQNNPIPGDQVFTVWDRTTEPQNIPKNVTLRILRTETFDLSLHIQYFGGGVYGYEPVYNGKQKYVVKVKDAVKTFNAHYVEEPQTATEKVYAYERNVAQTGIFSTGNTTVTLFDDITTYSNKAFESLQVEANKAFLKNGINVVGAILVGSVVGTAALVAAEAGAVTIALTTGEQVVANVVKDISLWSATVAAAASSYGIDIQNVISQGQQLVIKIIDNAITRYVVPVAS